LDEWETSAAQCVDIAIQRGVSSYRPKPAHKNIIWIIDPTAQVTRRDCDGYDLVIASSGRQADQLTDLVPVPVSVIGIANDPKLDPDAVAERLLTLIDRLGWEPRTRLADW
ncbi:MAG: hypothetical protein GY926_11520, partial [bacterium]|nr:hypothetical protein [bacterium]